MKKLVVIFVVLVMAVPGYAGEVMKFAYAEASPPLFWKGEDGQVRGILIDIADEAVQKRIISIS